MPNTGTLSFDTLPLTASPLDTVVGVYEMSVGGSSVADLTLVTANNDCDDPVSTRSCVVVSEVPLNVEKTYFIRVSGVAAAEGVFDLHWSLRKWLHKLID